VVDMKIRIEECTCVWSKC